MGEPLLTIHTQTRGRVELKQLMREFSDIATKEVRVGILEPQRTYPDDNVTLGEVALWNEFGVHDQEGNRRVPARSFIRSTIDQKADLINEKLFKMLQGIADHKIRPVTALRSIGVLIVNAMRSTIKRRISPQLAPLTLKLRKEKGITGTIPLYATQFLYKSISFAVRPVDASESSDSR